MLKLIFNLIAHFIIVIIVDGLMIHLVRSPRNKKGLLLIRLDGIGDFFLWLDSAKAYKKLYPDHHITLMGNSIWAPVAEKIPYWDAVWGIDREKMYSNLFYRLKILSRIRRAGFQIAIQTTVSRKVFDTDTVILATGAQEKIGATGDFTNISPLIERFCNNFYTKLIPVPRRKKTMILRSNSAFVHGLGMKDMPARDDSEPAIMLNTSCVISNEYKLSEFYVLIPGAGVAYRRWPASCFAELSDLIYQHYGLIGIIEGDKSEKGLAHSIIAAASSKNHLIDVTGSTSIMELMENIRHARFLVGNDSCGSHIAAYVHTPSCCILGGGYFGKFFPYDNQVSHHGILPISIYHYMDCFGCDWKRPCNPIMQRLKIAPCITAITVDSVWAEIQRIMDQAK